MKNTKKPIKKLKKKSPQTFGYIGASGFFKTQQENKARKKRMMFPITKRGASDGR